MSVSTKAAANSNDGSPHSARLASDRRAPPCWPIRRGRGSIVTPGGGRAGTKGGKGKLDWVQLHSGSGADMRIRQLEVVRAAAAVSAAAVSATAVAARFPPWCALLAWLPSDAS